MYLVWYSEILESDTSGFQIHLKRKIDPKFKVVGPPKMRIVAAALADNHSPPVRLMTLAIYPSCVGAKVSDEDANQ
jgi:hypothetical protein